jgi:hypothetical protein
MGTGEKDKFPWDPRDFMTLVKMALREFSDARSYN